MEHKDMVKVTAIRNDDHKRILRCSEGNRFGIGYGLILRI